MALPEDALCVRLSIDVDVLGDLGIVLPGGAELRGIFEVGTLPDASKLISQLMAQINTALTPFIPIFRVIEVCLQIAQCINKVVDSLLPPDPTALIKCIAKLIPKVSFLLKLIPQLNIPFFVKEILGLLILLLEELKTSIENILTVQVEIDLGRVRAQELNALRMEESLDCIQANLDLQFQAVTSSGKPLAILLNIVNLFLDIAGMDPIETEFDFGTDPSEATAPIQDIIDVLQVAYDALPARIGT